MCGSSKTSPRQQLMFIHLCLFACVADRILTGALSTFCIMRRLRCTRWQLANHSSKITKCFCHSSSNYLEDGAEETASVLAPHLMSSFDGKLLTTVCLWNQGNITKYGTSYLIPTHFYWYFLIECSVQAHIFMVPSASSTERVTCAWQQLKGGQTILIKVFPLNSCSHPWHSSCRLRRGRGARLIGRNIVAPEHLIRPVFTACGAWAPAFAGSTYVGCSPRVMEKQIVLRMSSNLWKYVQPFWNGGKHQFLFLFLTPFIFLKSYPNR